MITCSYWFDLLQSTICFPPDGSITAQTLMLWYTCKLAWVWSMNGNIFSAAKAHMLWNCYYCISKGKSDWTFVLSWSNSLGSQFSYFTPQWKGTTTFFCFTLSYICASVKIWAQWREVVWQGDRLAMPWPAQSSSWIHILHRYWI